MTHAGLLSRATTEDAFEDDWIEVANAEDEAPAGSAVLDAIAALQASLDRGIVPEVTIDVDNLGELDELDDDAIRAFFDEAD